MKVMSVDIETTGLVSNVHGVTEFAAVFFDDEKPAQKPQEFYRWINPDGYVWSNYCLELHADWLKRILARLALKDLATGAGGPRIVKNMDELRLHFLDWYSLVDSDGATELTAKKRGNITGTGKNFGTFDLKFIEFGGMKDIFRHRTYDWVKMYHEKGDKVPPDLQTCKQRAMLSGCTVFTTDKVSHNALDDAMDVYELITFGNKLYDAARKTRVDDPRQ